MSLDTVEISSLHHNLVMQRIGGARRWFLLLILISFPSVAFAASPSGSITDRSVSWPTIDQWQRVLFLQDYNTRVVLFGVAVLGAAAGLVGSFTLLRKRALLADALAHASLPGIALAFMVAGGLGMNAKSVPVLLSGATVSGLLGVGLVLLVRSQTKLKEDAGLGIALSVFFGAGIALLGVVQQMETGRAAGLEGFIYGKTASMNANDARLIALASCVAIIGCLLLFKEFKLLCFDENFAGSRGMPVLALDLSLMSLVVLVTIVGLQAVGLILVVALFVTPAAAARFWTERLWVVAWLSAFLGSLGGLVGGAASALMPRLPSGAMIVLASTALFTFSMFFGSARGVLIRWLRRAHVNRRIRRQHLLRGLYEILELEDPHTTPHNHPAVPIEQLLEIRSWSRTQLQRTLASAEREQLVNRQADSIRLTRAGYVQAARLTRDHRLWELYLITHADTAPSRVDRDADRIEHVLEPELIDELEHLLQQQPVRIPVPANPHGVIPSGEQS
ncbi:metal ABC transporter permease [Allorhodopirellula heiligendammensis]|uniref:Manganese transport system membrane protein MntB n=1 Tax=Allorhodopirellula heiligendammensis TaxID=2714739 RepID=A0A5C6C2M3_9BACT|nr:iron chelate uptake ABC transporter family permease subunit [Allorhodopirellula heiligendammensis]TWU18790.1 Manganese transport system membrane protein MntB [Allorhodopirellula heiligendammensis]